MIKKILFLIFLFFLSACSLPKVAKIEAKTYNILIKSKLFKANNQAFLYRDKKALKLEFYELAQPFLSLIIKDQICLNKNCYDKTSFNKNFFKASFYPELLEDILSFKPIFKAKSLAKTNCGFKQSLKGIEYELCFNKLFFSLKKAKLIILINEKI